LVDEAPGRHFATPELLQKQRRRVHHVSGRPPHRGVALRAPLARLALHLGGGRASGRVSERALGLPQEVDAAARAEAAVLALQLPHGYVLRPEHTPKNKTKKKQLNSKTKN
jgi:hypothetical protein